MSGFLFKTIYRNFLVPLAQLLLPHFAKKNEKLRLGAELRSSPSGRPPWLEQKFNDPIWIHCSSGEFEYAKPVIEQLKKENPAAKVIVTFFSPSSLKNISSFTGVSFATPTPWETQKDWSAFLQHHAPRCLLIARTDLWPEMILQCKKHKVPMLLFSATLASESGRMKPLARPFYRWLLRNVSEVFCVSQGDLNNFRKLGVSNVSIQGDTRFDQVFARLQHPKPLKTALLMDKEKKNVFVAGSTWPEDEAVLFSALARIKKNHESLRIIIAPHEPTEHHLVAIERLALTSQLSSDRYSKAETWESDVLIIDEIGILAELYHKASFAFVGGSFRKTVHSVMEPLAAGCLTFVGPKHFNNREALEFSSRDIDSFKMVSAVDDDKEFYAIFDRQLRHPSITKLNKKIAEETADKTGGSHAVVDWINSLD